VSPLTLIVFGGSGRGAGGFTTEPPMIEYLLPWQGQLIAMVMLSTRHPVCVQIALNALNWPFLG
jgi:hypothetical protein